VSNLITTSLLVLMDCLSNDASSSPLRSEIAALQSQIQGLRNSRINLVRMDVIQHYLTTSLQKLNHNHGRSISTSRRLTLVMELDLIATEHKYLHNLSPPKILSSATIPSRTGSRRSIENDLLHTSSDPRIHGIFRRNVPEGQVHLILTGLKREGIQ
jgi:hypothetical protein